MSSDSDDQRPGFGEASQAGFALEDAVAFRRLMLDIYGERCAVTGHDSQDLEVYLFLPLAHGGRLLTGNALVVEPAVARLLDRGLLLISDDFVAFAPHPEATGISSDPETLRGHRLRLPEAISLWPDRAMLAYHRSRFQAQ